LLDGKAGRPMLFPLVPGNVSARFRGFAMPNPRFTKSTDARLIARLVVFASFIVVGAPSFGQRLEGQEERGARHPIEAGDTLADQTISFSLSDTVDRELISIGRECCGPCWACPIQRAPNMIGDFFNG
jgi:hypothetical protein